MPLLTVNAADAEYAGWKARAAECGMNLSVWVRYVLNGVAGGGRGSFQPSPQAGPVPGGTGPAAHSAPGSGKPTREPSNGAVSGDQRGNARSSGRKAGYTPRPRAAATSGMGVSTPAASESAAGEPATAGAPAPSTCTHPSDQRRVHPWGTTCGACGSRTR